MCDTLVKKNLTDFEKPKCVYKRVQKVGEGKYISSVMGETLMLNSWKKAPKRPQLSNQRWDSLVRRIRRPYKKQCGSTSSNYNSHHDGMWGSFKTEERAHRTDIISNFINAKTDEKYPIMIVKCEVKGTVHATRYNSSDTFLSEYLKVVEEIGLADCQFA